MIWDDGEGVRGGECNWRLLGEERQGVSKAHVMWGR